MEQGNTRKPSGERRSAPGGPTPAGRTRRSRRAEQERKQGPARPCAPQSARPDQRTQARPGTAVKARSIKDEYSRAAGNVTSAGMPFAGSRPARQKRSPAEVTNQRGAMELARRLEQYWHDKGFPAARFWAEPIEQRFEKIGSYELYRVASNLVDGLPPRYLETPDRSR
jgi:hypothetical protein